MRALAALLVMATPALAEATPPDTPSNRPEDGSFISQVMFTCDRGVQIPVAYVNASDGHSFAVIQIDGHQVAMVQVVSGSGIRYRSIDAARPYELHAKGHDGLFAYGPEADPQTLFTGCTAS